MISSRIVIPTLKFLQIIISLTTLLINITYIKLIVLRLNFHKDERGFPLYAIREIKFLKMLQHKNIVKLHDVITSKGCQHLEKNVKTDSLRSAVNINVADEKKLEANNKNKNNSEKGDKQNGDNSNTKQSEISKICGNLYLVFEYVEHDLGKSYNTLLSCFYSIIYPLIIESISCHVLDLTRFVDS